MCINSTHILTVVKYTFWRNSAKINVLTSVHNHTVNDPFRYLLCFCAEMNIPFEKQNNDTRFLTCYSRFLNGKQLLPLSHFFSCSWFGFVLPHPIALSTAIESKKETQSQAWGLGKYSPVVIYPSVLATFPTCIIQLGPIFFPQCN